jgi:hypothetical protein
MFAALAGLTFVFCILLGLLYRTPVASGMLGLGALPLIVLGVHAGILQGRLEAIDLLRETALHQDALPSAPVFMPDHDFRSRSHHRSALASTPDPRR